MDLQNKKAIDKSDMWKVISESSDQFKDGTELAKGIKPEGNFQSITISGMGGSALPGNLVRTYLDGLIGEKRLLKKNFSVYQNRTYSLPPEAYADSLNLICSFSGNTEETIDSFQEALDNNLPCIGISHGGKIKDMCEAHGAPHIELPFPYENFQPRMATGYFFSVIVRLLSDCGVIPDVSGEIAEAAERMKKSNIRLEESAKEIARKLKGKTPIIYASPRYKSLAMIWKIKFNENSKVPAFWNYFPELNHNEMVGFTNPQADFSFIFIKDAADNPKNLKRYDVLKDILEKKGMAVETVEMPGDGVFEKMFSTLILADWTSYYLALEYGQDPTPVDMVEGFKKALS